jgi:hypothetical protein
MPDDDANAAPSATCNGLTPALSPARTASASPATWPPTTHRHRVGASIAVSIALHALGVWLAPNLVAAWKEPPLIAFSTLILPQSANPRDTQHDEPRDKPRGKSERTIKAPDRDLPPSSPRLAQSAPTPAIEFGERELEGIVETNSVNVALDESSRSALAALPRMVSTPESSNAPYVPGTTTDQAVDSARFELPAQVNISYRAVTSISDGVARYAFRHEDGRYETQSTLEATGFFVSMFAGLMQQSSRGTLSAKGLTPERFEFRRGESAPDLAEFRHATSELVLTRRGSAKTQPLPPQLQDTQSFVFQLAYLLAQGQDAGKALDVLVTNARKVYRHRFKIVGAGPLETDLGVIEAVHLVSEADNEEDVYEAWLSPAHHNLPVKLKFHAGRFPIELIATSIRSKR